MHNIGIVGAGHFARAHLSALERHSNRARVAQVARSQTDARWPEAEALGATSGALTGMLATRDVDAVVVCTPNHLHCRHAIAALRAGKHVFCEKPMALTVADADAMAAVARECHRILMIGHLTRHAPLYVAVSEALSSGRTGKPLAGYSSRLHAGGSDRPWRMDPRLGGGVVFDLMIHDLDLITWFLGPPVLVHAEGQRNALGAFDAIRAVYTLSAGGEVEVLSSFRLEPGKKSLSAFRLVCEGGELHVDSANESYPIEIRPTGKPAEGIPVPLNDALLRGLSSEWQEFLDTIDGAAPGRLRIEDARQAVLMAEKTIASAEQGGASIPLG